MKRSNRHIAQHLNVKLAGLDIHVGRLCGLSANLLENVAEVGFDFGAPVSSMGKLPWVEHCGVLGKSITEFFPIEIVEGLDKVR